jgi:hypothetical protein
MKWRSVVVLTFLFAALMIPATASASADTFQFRRETAFVAFSGPDPNDACIQRAAFVLATEGRVKEGPGTPEAVSEVSVGIFQYNNCTNEELLENRGTATVSAEAFQVQNQLNTATLRATVEVCDENSSNCFPVDINLTWTGTGDVMRDKFTHHDTFGSCKLFLRSLAKSRTAVASGSVTALGINFATGDINFAQIASTKSGRFEINCP